MRQLNDIERKEYFTELTEMVKEGNVNVHKLNTKFFGKDSFTLYELENTSNVKQKHSFFFDDGIELKRYLNKANKQSPEKKAKMLSKITLSKELEEANLI